MRKTVINKCRSCLSENLKDILSLGSLYLADFKFLGDKFKSKKYPLTLVLCQKCSLVQLRETTPQTKLYTDGYGYKSGVSNTMRTELGDVTKKAEKFVSLEKRDIVVDIGCNDGTLLGSYRQKNIQRCGFDPIGKFAKDQKRIGGTFINNYFNASDYQKRFKHSAKIVTSVAMFYDVSHPNSFLSDVCKILHPNGVFIIQQNYLVGMLEMNAFDNIVHEHLEYYSLLSLENLLSRHGLKVIDVEMRSINGGSFRTYVTFKENKNPVSRHLLNMREKEKNLHLNRPNTYKKFAKRIEKVCQKLTEFVRKEVRKGKKVYVYGASTRGNTLLQYCKLDDLLITAAVERNPAKWGKKIASVNIPIISEEQARIDRPDYMLVLPWYFKEEFLQREEVYLRRGGKFIFPLPKMEIIGR